MPELSVGKMLLPGSSQVTRLILLGLEVKDQKEIKSLKSDSLEREAGSRCQTAVCGKQTDTGRDTAGGS